MPAAHPLDRPVWGSLAGPSAHFAVGGPLAKRYAPDVNRFASARDDSPEALAALAALLPADDELYILQVPDIATPGEARTVQRAVGVQMVAARSFADEPRSADMLPLGDADASEMLALATLTKPGPFLSRTHLMGAFIGIRIDGRLAAMAGERMRVPGFTEVSGVCVHPDFRGLGLARRLSAAVAAGVEKRGETPFLHAWKTNTPAIALYESLGFRHRCDVQVAVLGRPA